MGVEQESGQGAPDGPKSTGDPKVPMAFALGWEMARLHARAEQHTELDPRGREKLPGVSDLPSGQRTQLAITEIKALVHRLKGVIEEAGVVPPNSDRLGAAFKKRGREAIRDEIYRLHTELLERLMATNFRYGKAYGLGRALADSCRIRSSEDLEARWEEHRISGLQEWLSDLHSALPPHSARAVSLSMDSWRSWIAVNGSSHWQSKQSELTHHLARQGHLWRALLSGEKEGSGMLQIGDYLDAAKRLVTRSRKILAASLYRYLGVLVPAGIVLAAGLVAAISLEGAGEIIAGLGAAAAALGISWRGVGSTLRALAAQLRQPLWGAELDYAIAGAINRLPEVGAEGLSYEETPASGPARAYAADVGAGEPSGASQAVTQRSGQ